MDTNKGCSFGGLGVFFVLIVALLLFKNLWKIILVAMGLVVVALVVLVIVSSSKDKKAKIETDIATGNISERVAAYRKMLSELMYYYYNIHDKTVKTKLKQVEKAANRMIETVKADARDADKAGRFMRTALDGAKRVMKTYRTLEKAPEGENIEKAKASALESLDKVIKAFDEQNKKLYDNDVLNMDVETEVLNQALEEDFSTTDKTPEA